MAKREDDCVVYLNCPTCDGPMVGFFAATGKPGAVSRQLDPGLLAYFKQLTGACPNHFAD